MTYVLINTDIGSEREVLSAVKKIENITEVCAVYGVYDMMAKIEAESMEKLKKTITWKIRRLNKVRSTLTMITMEDS